MKYKLLIFAFVLIVFSNLISASLEDVKYPVSELGNCNSQAECENYCDDINNIETCLSVAEKYGIMSADEIAKAKKFLPYLKAGTTPGGCKSEKECDDYCNNEANINECVDFALKVGDISQEEAEMIKKTGGKGPGGCKKEECDSYCEDESHINECIDFAVKYGLMPAEEAEMAKRTGGKGPGNCKGKEECDNYCKDESHIEECIEFSIKHGFMKPEDAERMRKTGGKSPGDCKSEEECNAFCNSEEGRKVCTEFSCQYGLMTPEECEKMKKQMSATPIPCNSEEECDRWCQESEENTRLCMRHSLEAGFMSQEDYDREINNMGNKEEIGKCNCNCEEKPGQRLTGTNCIEDKCECFYAPYEEGELENMQPGTEQVERVEQTTPGDLITSEPGTATAEPVIVPEGDMGSGGMTPGDAPATEAGEAPAEPIIVEEAAPVTGAVIGESRDNWLLKIINFIFGI